MRAPIGWRKTASLTPTEAAAVIREETGQPCSRSLFYEWLNERRIPTHIDRQHRLKVQTSDLLALTERLKAEAHQQGEQPTLFGTGEDGDPR